MWPIELFCRWFPAFLGVLLCLRCSCHNMHIFWYSITYTVTKLKLQNHLLSSSSIQKIFTWQWIPVNWGPVQPRHPYGWWMWWPWWMVQWWGNGKTRIRHRNRSLRGPNFVHSTSHRFWQLRWILGMTNELIWQLSTFSYIDTDFSYFYTYEVRDFEFVELHLFCTF